MRIVVGEFFDSRARRRRRSEPAPSHIGRARSGQQRATTQGGKVKQQKMKWMTLIFLLGAILFLGACHKKIPPPPPPPPPPPAAPTASLTANPNTVEKGEPTTLSWQTTNAT